MIFYNLFLPTSPTLTDFLQATFYLSVSVCMRYATQNVLFWHKERTILKNISIYRKYSRT